MTVWPGGLRRLEGASAFDVPTLRRLDRVCRRSRYAPRPSALTRATPPKMAPTAMPIPPFATEGSSSPSSLMPSPIGAAGGDACAAAKSDETACGRRIGGNGGGGATRSGTLTPLATRIRSAASTVMPRRAEISSAGWAARAAAAASIVAARLVVAGEAGPLPEPPPALAVEVVLVVEEEAVEASGMVSFASIWIDPEATIRSTKQCGSPHPRDVTRLALSVARVAVSNEVTSPCTVRGKVRTVAVTLRMT